MKKWEVLIKVIKGRPKRCSTIPLIFGTRFNQVLSRTIDNPTFRTFVTSQKDILAKFDVQILQGILLSHPFLMLWNCKTKSCQWYTESNGLNLFSRIRWIVEQGLGYLFLPQLWFSTSRFLNQTDLEQYLFNLYFSSGPVAAGGVPVQK